MIRRLILIGVGVLGCLLLGYQALAASSPTPSLIPMPVRGGGTITPTTTLTPTATLTPTVMPTFVPISLSSYLPLVVKAPPPPTATPTPIPTNTPTPTATAVPPTAIPPTPTLITVNPTCSEVANTAAPNVPIAITNVNKAGNPETVTIRNKSTQTVDLTGWWICSMHGNQRHAILSGTIAPGQSLVIVSQAGGPIWNNTTVDPAVLFRRDGFQVSYRSQ